MEAEPSSNEATRSISLGVWTNATPLGQGFPRQIHVARFCATADLAGLTVSFGSTGDCFDNAAMETFWSTIKREIAWIRGSIYFPTRDQARLHLFEYIEVFYNRGRHQAGLGHRTPAEYAATFIT